MLQAIILCMALCMDAFVASVAYGADRIRIGWKGMALMSGVGSACLGAALGFGMVIMEWLPRGLTQAVCFVSLFFLGLIRLSDSAVKAYINRHAHLCRNIHFSFSSLRFILTSYADPSAADRDRNRVLSAREALFLGLAMSIDSLAAGTFAAFMEIPVFFTLLTAFAMDLAAMCCGQAVGKKLAGRLKWDLSWLSGLLFLLLAGMRFI